MTVTFGYVDSGGGARICYVTEPGQGTPVLVVLNTQFVCASVLSHYSGGLAHNRGIADGASWYMFDWRGSGKSTKPPGPITFTDLIDDVEAVADAIGGSADIYAVNDGCGIALAFAARRPEMVRRLLLVAPQGHRAMDSESTAATRRAFQAEPVAIMAQYLGWVHPATDTAETYEIAKEAIAAKPSEVGVALEQALAGVDLFELGPGVARPAYLIASGDGMEDAIELAACMPFARAANWTQIGDGTINGATWRRSWDEMIPAPERAPTPTISGDPALSAGLSVREAEILRLLCRGLTNAEIAAMLAIARSTAKRHVANIFAKLGVESRPKAIALAYERGLAPVPDVERRE